MAQSATRPAAARPAPSPAAQAAAAPMLTNVVPKSAQPGEPFDLIGTDLGGVTKVRLMNSAGTQFAALNVMVISSTDVRATVPQIAPGPYRVAAIADRNGFQISNALDFTVLVSGPRPAFNAADPFDPASGKPGTRVTINGKHLAQVTRIKFHGTPADTVNHDGGSDTVLKTKVPQGATTGPIKLIAPTGSTKSANDFVVT